MRTRGPLNPWWKPWWKPWPLCPWPLCPWPLKPWPLNPCPPRSAYPGRVLMQSSTASMTSIPTHFGRVPMTLPFLASPCPAPLRASTLQFPRIVPTTAPELPRQRSLSSATGLPHWERLAPAGSPQRSGQKFGRGRSGDGATPRRMSRRPTTKANGRRQRRGGCRGKPAGFPHGMVSRRIPFALSRQPVGFIAAGRFLAQRDVRSTSLHTHTWLCVNR
jgi:hypothetical protein